MSATKWTPGPWKKTPGVNRVRAGAVVIAYVNTAANSHLIEAAPEMAEALEAMLVGCRHLGGPSGDVLAAARAALAKARGES